MPHVHFIGIGGTGLSAIARVLLESGYTVSGSDRQLSPLAENLQAAGARVCIGHQAENIDGAELVIRSSAIPDDNPEVQAAQAAGIPVLKRADFLGRLMADRTGIAVAGTHGKTTTTAMIAWMLTKLGQDPTFIIGGVSKNLGTNAHAGKGRPFVIEADEYDRMFLGLLPEIAVVTNIEHDHPDCFPTAEKYYQAFLAFAARLSTDGILLACRNDSGAARLLEDAARSGERVLSYGIPDASKPFSMNLDCQARDLQSVSSAGFRFQAYLRLPSGETSTQISLQAPGEHNVCNALAALAVAGWMGLPLAQAAQALSEYSGTGRRFDVIGEAGGVTVIDDYAHHPTEIRMTLAAARARFPERELWAVWQPHTYSRTRSLFQAFTDSFDDADHVLVTEVYPAREPVSATFSSRQLVAAMKHPDAHYAADLPYATSVLLGRLKPGDVLLVLSAGDADQISANVLSALEERSRTHD